MQIEMVKAHAFGPFVDETLRLAPAMTVIHGPNESGKSSWHAALYVGLCGVRRARGRGNKEDQDFKDRHHPWVGDAWEVSTIVRLSDGRHVELHHDLNGKVDCWAQDADLGRDYSSEIIHDGSPDGARWLGLNRRSFASTACIRQADIQSVMEQANALQDELQRAAATAGTDSTAAAALERLVHFRRENVGLDRANSTRPLRAAKNRHERAQQELNKANESHEDYLDQLQEVERLRREKDDAERSLQLVEAARSVAQAKRREEEARRARMLSEKYPDEPPSRSESSEVIGAVNSALTLWDERPDMVKLQGQTAEELRSQLDWLPSMPKGDIRVHESVVVASEQYSLACSILKRHQDDRQPAPPVIETGGLDALELRRLAVELTLTEPTIDPQIEERVAKAREKVQVLREADLAQSPQESRPVPLILRPVVFLLRIILAPFKFLLTAARRSADQAVRIKVLEEQRKAELELREMEDQLGNAKYRLEEVRRRLSEAENRAVRYGLPIEPEVLEQLAQRVEQADQVSRDLEVWRIQDEENVKASDCADFLLRAALEKRGVADMSSTADALARYEDECIERERVATEASRRPDLEQAYEERLRAESLTEASTRQLRETIGRLHAAAEAVGVTDDTDDEMAARLADWHHNYQEDIQRLDHAHSEWNELQRLLDGGTLPELEQDAVHRRLQVEQLTVGLESEEIDGVRLEANVETQLRELRRAVSVSSEALAGQEGRIRQYSKTMPSVPEAEEELESAKVELRRIKMLERTLDSTLAFLERAQDKVHRTVVPLLRDVISPWLQQVTDGRYTDTRIDAESLLVRVSGDGRSWRVVPHLSHGTVEQVYLLLRIAMARLLTREGETCPLILDDVTVNCDPQRQAEIMDILHTISREQQVIVFSQELEIFRWAQEHLIEPHDRVVELPLSEIRV